MNEKYRVARACNGIVQYYNPLRRPEWQDFDLKTDCWTGPRALEHATNTAQGFRDMGEQDWEYWVECWKVEGDVEHLWLTWNAPIEYQARHRK